MKPCRMKAEHAGYAGGVLVLKKKKSVAGQFAAVKYRLETYCWTRKTKQGFITG